jgi:hypothetical protein
MLAVMGLKPGKVAFQAISRGRYTGINKVMKHIRQSPEEHAPGPLDITKDRARFGPYRYLGAVLIFPGIKKPEKLIPVMSSVDTGNFEKYIPELPGVGGLGIGAAPGQSLALDMDEAPLHQSVWPECPDNLHDLGIAVNGKAARAQSKRIKEPQNLRLGTFGNPVPPGYDSVGVSIHQDCKAKGTVQKCAVEDEVFAPSHVQSGLWRRLQVMIDHTVKLPRAVPALSRQLPDRITLHNPASEPFQFICFSGPGVIPAKGALA